MNEWKGKEKGKERKGKEKNKKGKENQLAWAGKL